MTPEEHLAGRLAAVERWLASVKRLTVVGDIRWGAQAEDLRWLAINYIVRRQLEALEAAVVLAKAGLGHLAVGFVRPALDELLWLLWIKDLPLETSQELLSAMARSDAVRSLAAQRTYIGDEAMQRLWYPVWFLDQQAAQQDSIKETIAALREQLRWDGRPLPHARWVAEQSGQGALYDYLHAAASRALHFSMGEALRNSWGAPGGIITTKKPEFRQYRAEFALHQLPVLFIQMTGAVNPLLAGAGVKEPLDECVIQEVDEAITAMAQFGPVPLIHAHEWNLAPEGIFLQAFRHSLEHPGEPPTDGESWA